MGNDAMNGGWLELPPPALVRFTIRIWSVPQGQEKLHQDESRARKGRISEYQGFTLASRTN